MASSATWICANRVCRPCNTPCWFCDSLVRGGKAQGGRECRRVGYRSPAIRSRACAGDRGITLACCSSYAWSRSRFIISWGCRARHLEMVARLGVRYRVFIHDYAWICPRVTLLSGAGKYCGEPAIEACEACVAQHGSAFEESIRVVALRERSANSPEGGANHRSDPGRAQPARSALPGCGDRSRCLGDAVATAAAHRGESRWPGRVESAWR